MSNLKEIFVRTDICTGCNTCKIACAVEHSASKNLFAAINETPRPKSRVYVEWLPDNTKVPVLCRHCEDAPCISITEDDHITSQPAKCQLIQIGWHLCF